MKKIITAMLVASMILAFAACGNNVDETTTAATTTAETTTAETTTGENTTAETTTEETTAAPIVAAEDAKTVLSNVYGNFLDKLAPLFGASSGEELKGYFVSAEMEEITEVDPETGEEYTYPMPVSGPGVLSLEDTDNLAYYTLFPAESVSKLNSAACFFNMMNMNNGTVAAFEVKDAGDVTALADTMKEKITTNMWMCGFPERYLIVNVNGTLISAFGNADTINSLKDGVLATYADAAVLYDAAL